MVQYEIPEYPYAKPRVVVSKCLEFENVRYDGSVIHCQTVRDMMPFADFITVCPEVEIGLGVPRDSMRIVLVDGKKRLIQPITQNDLTEKMDNFTDTFLKELPQVDGFIFKSGSPTIGMRDIKIYSDKVKGLVVDRGNGFFAEKILRDYIDYPMEEDDRLKNNIIRHHFITKLFAFADLRKVKESGSIENLEQFHQYNHYLFRLYSHNLSLKLDELVENKSSLKFDAILKEYERIMPHIFSREPKSNEFIDVANETFLNIVSSLNIVEEKYLAQVIKKYTDNRLTCDALLEILKFYVMRFSDSKKEYSRLFFPYPEELKTESEPERDRDFWANFPIASEQSKVHLH
jgi:uncharacterized protein YbbK (DUF523 family)/uncharacterized protein YbgA (DUF1722 family)